MINPCLDMDPESSAISLAHKIEALLFAEGGAITHEKLARETGASLEEIHAAYQNIRERFAGSIVLTVSDVDAQLTVSQTASEFLTKEREEALRSDIGDAGLEVLSLVLYRGPSTRSEIDYVRGVNSTSALRSLLSRGLIERLPGGSRETSYGATSELLVYLGVTSREKLPEYDSIKSELAQFEIDGEKENGPFHTHENTTSNVFYGDAH